MLKQVLQFTQRPVYEEDKNQDLGYRLAVLGKLILWALAISFAFLTLVGVMENAFDLDFGKHASEDLLENYSMIVVVFLVVIVAPLFEELIFRAPLYWFRRKTALRVALYLSIILFGLIHIINFEDYATYWWMIPLLVAPQMSLGMFAGFIRVRFGLLWAMALHAGYNLILSFPLIIGDMLTFHGNE